MRELDLLLNRFLDQDYARLDSRAREAFASLLDTPDPDLYAWILGRQPAPTEFRKLVEQLQRLSLR